MSGLSAKLRRGACLVLAVAIAGCAREPARGVVVLHGPTMGTTWSLTIAARREIPAAERGDIERAVRETLERIERLVSTWDPGSELSRFNRFASLEPFAVSPETFDMFRWAVRMADDTGGALDVTVAPLVTAWGFGPGADEDALLPDEREVAALRETVGIHLLKLDPEGRWVRKLHTAVQCDFSALAPGYAADRVAAVLERRGLGDFLIDVGGELAARGRNAGGEPWRVAVELPDDAGVLPAAVPLADAAMTTSGDYRHYREVNGRRISHLIDPRTGHPIRHALASATVVERLAVRADALATAIMVLGPTDGLALARRLDVAALLVMRGDDGRFETVATPRFQALLE